MKSEHLFYVWFDSMSFALMWADTCDYPVKLGKVGGKWYVGF